MGNARISDLQPTTNHRPTEKEESGAKKPRKLKQFTLQQQVEILDELVASGGNKYRLAKKYKMSRSCLQYWQRNEDQIRASVASGHGAGYKVSCGKQRRTHPALEEALADWVQEKERLKDREVVVEEIAKQALVLYRQMGGQGKFTASQSWVERFLKRYELHEPPLEEAQPKKFPCPQCGKRLSSQYALKMHSTIHTGERPHICLFCAKDFRGKKELEYHERTHTGEKPYKCNLCGKTCVDASNMKKHEKAHTVEDLSVAETEGSKFYTKLQL